MNCSQCGAPVDPKLKFCTQCGARIVNRQDDTADYSQDDVFDDYQEDTLKQIPPQLEGRYEQEEEKPVTRPVAISRPRKTSDGIYSGKGMSDSRHVSPGRSYEWANLKGISGFAETLLAIITNPITSGEELYLRLSGKVTMIYTSAIIMLNACISYLLFRTLANKTTQMFYDVFDYFFGYGTVQYLIGELNIQVLLLSILADVLMILYITLLIIGIYKVLLKVDIEWVECIQLMMMPMVMGFFGKIIIFIVGLLSIKAALFLIVALFILEAVLTVLQFINRLGVSALTVYTTPPLYVICSMVCGALIIQILKGYI